MDDDKPISSLENETIGEIKIGDILSDTITINVGDMSSMAGSSGYLYSTLPSYSYGNVTLNTSSGLNGSWSNITSNNPSLHVTGTAEFDSDIKVKGVSILEALNKIEKRLAILRPDPEKLEHFEALRKAYEHYKTLEALCELPSKEEKE